MPGLLTNGMTQVGSGSAALGTFYAQVSGGELIPIDTGKVSGSNPQSVAASAFDIAALAAGLSVNTATSTANAATLNTLYGRIVTESLSTAAAATYTMTLTNSIITTSTVFSDCAIQPLSSTVRGLTFTSATPASGSAVLLFTNTGTAAVNGTHVITFRIG